MEVVDVAIVGGGPAGSTCAAFCAGAGLRTLILEREKFPREKVCGDCINPACWPVLERLELAEQIRNWPHAALNAVEFIAIGGQTLRVELPQIDIVRETFAARIVVGADGRNSTVARLRNLLPRPERERVALQAHVPLPKGFGNRIVLQLLPEGYSGQAPVNDDELNLCLVGTPPTISSLRTWAEQEFKLPANQAWRTITPLTRAPISVAHENLFFIGDAARVVEPFTGEGIYYALRSGELAANAIIKILGGEDRESALRQFVRAHRAMYRGRLWVNRLARAAVLSPKTASRFLRVARFSPTIMRLLTKKIVGRGD